jgi:hypothetical protein
VKVYSEDKYELLNQNSLDWDFLKKEKPDFLSR